MKSFRIFWENCFMDEGSVVIKAKTEAAAERLFNKDYGPDYCIICIKSL